MSAQPLVALEIANETRLAGAAFRRELRAMTRDDALATVRRLLEHGAHGPLGGQRVEQLLRAIPRLGRERAGMLLQSAHVRPDARVRDLTPERRAALLSALEQPIPQRPRRKPPPMPRRLPAAPLVDWLTRHYRTPEQAALELGVSARSLRHMQRAREVQTRTVDDVLTRLPICMHDLYPPDEYPGLYG